MLVDRTLYGFGCFWSAVFSAYCFFFGLIVTALSYSWFKVLGSVEFKILWFEENLRLKWVFWTLKFGFRVVRCTNVFLGIVSNQNATFKAID